MTAKKLTDYIKQSISVQGTKKEEQPKPAQVRILFEKETELQETPIGKIPKEWKVVRLGDIVEVWDNYRVPVKEQDRKKGEYPYCGANGIIDYVDGYTHDGEFVLLAEDGGFFGPYEKSAYIMRGKIWANNHVHVLKAIEGRATNEFLMFYLNFMDLRPFLTGSTRPKITQKDMLRIPIPLPPLSEQKVIAEILSTVDSAIDRVRRLVERADKIKKGLMQELFTKGIGHKEYKETPIGKMPKDWRLERLSNISSEIKAGGTPLRSRREYWNGDIPFVKIEDMTNSFKYLLTISETITKEGLENSNAWLVPENSLLLAIYGSLGEVVINKIKVTTNQAILAIIPRNPKDVEYLYYWFLYYKPNWKKYAKPTTQPNLTKEIVENTLLPYPPSSEREKIAEILSTVDEYIRVLRVKLERLEHVKKWLMDVLLTGKVRVIVEPS